MRNLVITAFAGIFLCACDNSIAVDAEFIERTFVYSLLDGGDSIHYVRVQKSFLESGVNPYTLTSDPENIYYHPEELSVFIEQWVNGVVMETWALQQVSGDTLDIPKDAGLFAQSPNILYQFAAQLDYTATYKLIIQNHLNDELITAETKMVYPFEVLFPTAAIPGFDFTDTARIYYIFRYAANANIYDLKMRMHYTEEDLITGNVSTMSLDWVLFSNILGDNISGSGIIAYPLAANAFLYFMQSAFDPGENILREFLTFDFIFYAGGEEMYLNYLYLLANTGITEQYATTQYTNITNGFGVFSSRYANELNDLIISPKTTDSLACGSVTGNLNFASSIFNPAYPVCD